MQHWNDTLDSLWLYMNSTVELLVPCLKPLIKTHRHRQTDRPGVCVCVKMMVRTLLCDLLLKSTPL